VYLEASSFAAFAEIFQKQTFKGKGKVKY